MIFPNNFKSTTNKIKDFKIDEETKNDGLIEN